MLTVERGNLLVYHELLSSLDSSAAAPAINGSSAFFGYEVLEEEVDTLSVIELTAPMAESKMAGMSIPVLDSRSSSVFLKSSRLSSKSK